MDAAKFVAPRQGAPGLPQLPSSSTEPASRSSRSSCWNSLLSEQIAKYKRISFHNFTCFTFHGLLKNRPVVDERMKFSIFPSRVGVRGQIAEEEVVKVAPRKTPIQDSRIDADRTRSKSRFNERARQFAGVPFPNWKNRLHTDFRKVLLAIDAQVFQKNIAERHAPDALLKCGAHRRFHSRFINWVHALRRYSNLMQRQADALRLSLQKFAPHAVHADALESLRDRCEQPGDTDFFLLE